LVVGVFPSLAIGPPPGLIERAL